MRMFLLLAMTGLLLGALGLAQASESTAKKSPCAPGCGGCDTAAQPATAANPFLAPYGTPYNVPPFEKIKLEHFRPAFEEGMKRNLAEIDAIVNNPQPPTFANTIEALDRSGELLGEVSSVFFGRVSVDTNDEIQKLNQEIAPRLAAHRDAIAMNSKLFMRVRMLYNQREQLGLTGEQLYLLENLYRGYIRSGVSLPEVEQEKLRAINRQLSVLGVQYSQNVLAETNAYRLVIEKSEDLAGLPESVVAAAADAAKEAGLAGKWVFTTQKPSMLPFLQYAQNRELRRQIYTAYIQRGDNDNASDNKAILNDIM
ncbi:MAG TPA: peptidase M3, partial [Acidobacteriota bacterium]|nr:peptidase M3 [Acidobacteriota bacterium]